LTHKTVLLILIPYRSNVLSIEDISEGEIYIGERFVNDLAPKDRDIAMVFQEYALYAI
jgi:ABC-type sugar transport system ATPase subunit